MGKEIRYSFRRYEKKYMLTAAQYEALRRELEPYMTADVYGTYTPCSLYYDTEDCSLIRASLEKPLYKEKLRMRSYGVPGDGDRVFVEMKKKFDHVVYKRRVELPCRAAAAYLEGAGHPGEGQIFREMDWFLQFHRDLRPSVFIACDRCALAGREDGELRMTFDTGLRWRREALDLRLGDWGAPILPPDQVLMEMKIPGAVPLWLSRILSRNRIFPISFSKYGTCYVREILPRKVPNLLKEKERTVHV